MKVTYENVKPFIEGLKQMGRIVLLGILPIMISGINIHTGEIGINWMVIQATAGVIVLTAILSGLDKDRHLTGKLEDNETKTKGLTGF